MERKTQNVLYQKLNFSPFILKNLHVYNDNEIQTKTQAHQAIMKFCVSKA